MSLRTRSNARTVPTVEDDKLPSKAGDGNHFAEAERQHAKSKEWKIKTKDQLKDLCSQVSTKRRWRACQGQQPFQEHALTTGCFLHSWER